MKFRASELPSLAKCPAAAHPQPGEIIINREDRAGNLGSAIHEAGKILWQDGHPVLVDIAAQFGLTEKEADDLSLMYSSQVAFYRKYRPLFVTLVVEDLLTYGDDETGHLDVGGLCTDGVVRVLDHKSTRLQTKSYDDQLWWYCLALMRRIFGEQDSPEAFAARQAQHITCFLRETTESRSEYRTAAQLETWHDDIVRAIEDWDGITYHPGDPCYYCKRVCECLALKKELGATAMAWSTARSLEDLEALIVSLEHPILVEAWEKISQLGAMLDRTRSIIKEWAIANDRWLQGNGKALEVRCQTREEIIPIKAWDILKKYLTDQELAECISVSKTEVLKVVGKKAGRGKGKKAKEGIIHELGEANAIEKNFKDVARVVAADEPEVAELPGEGDD